MPTFFNFLIDGAVLGGGADISRNSSNLMAAIMTQPMWLQTWVGWMTIVNLGGALVFLRRMEARWTLLAFVGAFLTMNALYAAFGYQRILGLAHVLFWTPLLLYLWRRRRSWDAQSRLGKWIATVFITNSVSLVIDYIDVARFLAGERL